MKGLFCTAYGTPPALEVGEIAEEPLKEGEVRIAVGAVGLGFFDVVFLGGKYQEKPPLPIPAGREHAGRIVEVGPGVDPAKIGRLVAAIGYGGALANRTVALEARCCYLPDDMDVVDAACVPSAYTTALYALQDCGKLQPGERVLILGASGTVGIGSIHVTKALGGRPIAMASTAEKRDYCLSEGAEVALDGSDPNWRKALEAAVGKVDLVVDSVGGDLSETAFRCLAPGGRHLVVGFAAGSIPTLPLNLALLKRSSAVGVDLGGFMKDQPEDGRDLMRRMAALVADGRITPKPTSVHPIGEVGEVLESLASRRNMGKPVIRIEGW